MPITWKGHMNPVDRALLFTISFILTTALAPIVTSPGVAFGLPW